MTQVPWFPLGQLLINKDYILQLIIPAEYSASPVTSKSKRYEAICFKRSLVGRSFDYHSSDWIIRVWHQSVKRSRNPDNILIKF
jgi:hypothetical protein